MGFLSPKRSFTVFHVRPTQALAEKWRSSDHRLGTFSIISIIKFCAGWKSRSTKFLQTQEQQTNKELNQLRTVEVGSFPDIKPKLIQPFIPMKQDHDHLHLFLSTCSCRLVNLHHSVWKPLRHLTVYTAVNAHEFLLPIFTSLVFSFRRITSK